MISLSPWLLVAIALAVIALGVVSAFAITRARRLDRLHQRILASRDSLSRLLLRRASEVDLLTRSAGLDGSGLAEAALHPGRGRPADNGWPRPSNLGATPGRSRRSRDPFGARIRPFSRNP